MSNIFWFPAVVIISKSLVQPDSELNLSRGVPKGPKRHLQRAGDRIEDLFLKDVLGNHF